jgi:hypothetical protein
MESKNQDLIKLPGSFDVSPAFMAAVRTQAESRIPMLMPDTLYRAKDILGKNYWKGLTKWEALKAGHCLAYLVMREELPISNAGKRPDNSIVYVMN